MADATAYTFVKGIISTLKDLAADYEAYEEKRSFSERSENDTLPGMDNMTEEKWRMFETTVE